MWGMIKLCLSRTWQMHSWNETFSTGFSLGHYCQYLGGDSPIRESSRMTDLAFKYGGSWCQHNMRQWIIVPGMLKIGQCVLQHCVIYLRRTTFLRIFYKDDRITSKTEITLGFLAQQAACIIISKRFQQTVWQVHNLLYYNHAKTSLTVLLNGPNNSNK